MKDFDWYRVLQPSTSSLRAGVAGTVFSTINSLALLIDAQSVGVFPEVLFVTTGRPSVRSTSSEDDNFACFGRDSSGFEWDCGAEGDVVFTVSLWDLVATFGPDLCKPLAGGRLN